MPNRRRVMRKLAMLAALFIVVLLLHAAGA